MLFSGGLVTGEGIQTRGPLQPLPFCGNCDFFTVYQNTLEVLKNYRTIHLHSKKKNLRSSTVQGESVLEEKKSCFL